MKRLAVVAATVPSLAWSGTALTCENPGGEHQVTHEPGASNLVLTSPVRDALDPVLVDDQDASHVVTASTVEGGPTARLHLRPCLKMEVWSDGQLMQTDGCHAATP